MTDEHDDSGTRGFARRMAEHYEREDFLDGLREKERRMLAAFGDCTCADAPLCRWFRRPGDLFADGLPESVMLP